MNRGAELDHSEMEALEKLFYGVYGQWSIGKR